MIFYLNLFKAIKFALKVINLNRPAPNLQLGLGTNYDVGSCIQQYFLSSPGTKSAKKSNKRFKCSFFAMLCFNFFAMFCFNFFVITADGNLLAIARDPLCEESWGFGKMQRRTSF